MDIKYTDKDSTIAHLLDSVNAPEFDLTIYHIIIGSKMPDIELHSTEYPRNHEYPHIIRNIAANPYTQFSNILLNKLLSVNYSIKIRQIVVLIDPQYSQYPKLEGLEKPIPDISYYVISESITASDIENMITAIEPCSKRLINILDCTSNTLSEMYIMNLCPYIYINKPECLAIDSKIRYTPFITCNIDSDKINVKNLNYRWLNILDDYKQINHYRGNCKLFLDNIYFNRLLEVDLYTLCKLWSIHTYNFKITIPRYPPFLFSDLTYHEFITLSSNMHFIDAILHYLDNYYHSNIKGYLYSVQMTYYKTNQKDKLDNTTPILEFIKTEIWKILTKLNKISPDPEIESMQYAQLDRKFIISFLNKYHIY